MPPAFRALSTMERKLDIPKTLSLFSKLIICQFAFAWLCNKKTSLLDTPNTPIFKIKRKQQALSFRALACVTWSQSFDPKLPVHFWSWSFMSFHSYFQSFIEDGLDHLHKQHVKEKGTKAPYLKAQQQ
jgi:hypothetical protein